MSSNHFRQEKEEPRRGLLLLICKKANIKSQKNIRGSYLFYQALKKLPKINYPRALKSLGRSVATPPFKCRNDIEFVNAHSSLMLLL